MESLVNAEPRENTARILHILPLSPGTSQQPAIPVVVPFGVDRRMGGINGVAEVSANAHRCFPEVRAFLWPCKRRY